jgi:hypothetical protein
VDIQGLGRSSEAAPESDEVAKIPLGNADLTTDLVAWEVAAVDQPPHRFVGHGQDVRYPLKGQEWRQRWE